MELALRYRPQAEHQQQAHHAKVAALIADTADMPAERLERAAATWVRRERWMPAASDLIALCQQQQRDEAGSSARRGLSDREAAQSFCDQRNAGLAAGPRAKDGLEWFVDGAGEAKLRYRRDEPVMTVPVPRHQIDRLNRGLARFNAPFRYDDRGYDYPVTPEASQAA